MQRPVTWSDLRLAADAFDELRVGKLQASGARRLGRELADEEPAILDLDTMREFAAAVGARLPTAPELFAAQRSPEFERARDPAIRAEITSGAIVGDQLTALLYRDDLSEARPLPLDVRTFLERDSFGGEEIGHCTFRLAISETAKTD